MENWIRNSRQVRGVDNRQLAATACVFAVVGQLHVAT